MWRSWRLTRAPSWAAPCRYAPVARLCGGLAGTALRRRGLSWGRWARPRAGSAGPPPPGPTRGVGRGARLRPGPEERRPRGAGLAAGPAAGFQLWGSRRPGRAGEWWAQTFGPAGQRCAAVRWLRGPAGPRLALGLAGPVDFVQAGCKTAGPRGAAGGEAEAA